MIQKEFDDPQVFDDPNGISIESMDFDNPKVLIPPSSMVLFICSLYEAQNNVSKNQNNCIYEL